MTIAIIGAYGAVGRAAVRRLADASVHPLLVGGRDEVRARQLAESLASTRVAIRASGVDATSRESLSRFCRGCRVIVSCAGPASELRDAVARAAFAAGASYVDASGDPELHERVRALERPEPKQRALIGSGMMPGLSELLLRRAAPLVGADRPIEIFVGGRAAMTRTAAVDYLAGAARTARDPRAAPPPDSVPFFFDTVEARPYASPEIASTAARLGLADVRFFSVFDGPNLLRALTGPRPTAGRLVLAASLDAFGLRPYVRMVYRSGPRALVAEAGDPSELSGAFAAEATLALLDGVATGVHAAADVLDPERTLARLADICRVEERIVHEDAEVEEGVL